MGFFNLSKKGVALALSAQLVLSTQAVTLAQAEMLSTEAAINSYATLDSRAALFDALERDDVQAEMVAMGVDPDEAAARLSALTDAEVASILTQIEEDNAGADIIGTLFTVFVILLVTDILCLTNVFPFTRCAR
ncbi:MAG: PA2779 family protein [Yoonia sp.]|uniref:PA2779 family protein n=1 Tax=Yoonia sp. TaxID=2212373 RepID=UPI003EF2B66F